MDFRLGGVGSMDVRRISDNYGVPKINKIQEENAKNQGTSVRTDLNIKDVYESSKDAMKVDFGGYNSSGRLNVAKNRVMATEDGIVTATKKNDNPSYIMNGVKNILGEDDKAIASKMKDNGMEVEDLIDSEKIKKLSDDFAKQEKLSNFASNERENLKQATGMNDDELNAIVAAGTNYKLA